MATDALLRPHVAALDDAALLRHFQRDRGIHFTPVIDDEEIRRERIDGILRGVFEFNGEMHTLPHPVPWLDNPSRDVEWHILLHKFYYAVGLGCAWKGTGNPAYARQWAQLVSSWIDVTPVDFIATDVTGRRVQNWIGSLHAFVFTGQGADTIDPATFRKLLHSLHAQVEHLAANLTPKRNHRTLELLAVFIAGVVLPEFERAAHWRELALRETVTNIHADLLIDGVHCELSTDYHHLALRNWLQVRMLALANGIDVPPAMDTALQRALEFSMHAHQPSGLCPSFSDGDVRSYLPLLEQGARLYQRSDMLFVATQGKQGKAPARRVASFAASGYHVIRSAWGDASSFGTQQHLLFDCGPLGEGNHGHFDALSFELAANGQALVVDPGRYTYSEAADTDASIGPCIDGGAPTNWRVHFRGTAAHNTVTVDGRHQTAYEPRAIKQASRHAHGSMRHKVVGRAPATRLVEGATSPVLDLLHGRCESEAYDMTHDRSMVLVDGIYWIVSDWLRAPQAHDVALNFQLSAQAQGATELVVDLHESRLVSPGLQIVQPLRSGQHAGVEGGWVSPSYGLKHAAPRCCTRARGSAVDFDSVLVADNNVKLHARLEPVGTHSGDRSDEGSGGVACAIAIGLQRAQGAFDDLWFHARDTPDAVWALRGLRFHGRWIHARFLGNELLRAVTHVGATVEGAAAQRVVTAHTGQSL